MKENIGGFSAKKLFSKYGIYVAFVALFVVLAVASPTFLTSQNLINVLRQVSVNGILAVGMTFVVLTGGIDLSVGSMLALSAVVATSFATTECGFPLPMAIFMGVLVGAGCGAFNGLFVAKFKVAPFIVTLAMTTIARGLALIITDGRPVINLTQEYTAIGNGSAGPVPYPVIILIAVLVVGIFLLHFTKYGRHVYAVGGNENSAIVSGINAAGVKFSTYFMSGICSAIAAIILSSRVMTGQPAAGEGYELDAIAAAVIGGTSLSGGVGTMAGTIIGMFILGFLSNGLDLLNVSSYWQQVVKGAIIIAAVLMDRKKAAA